MLLQVALVNGVGDIEWAWDAFQAIAAPAGATAATARLQMVAAELMPGNDGKSAIARFLWQVQTAATRLPPRHVVQNSFDVGVAAKLRETHAREREAGGDDVPVYTSALPHKSKTQHPGCNLPPCKVRLY